ncbi:mannan endo-1,6-alpha-mannosidase DCW1 precursor [Microthyrium microscopicum]|uniref:Mannan endo-1,6-alpha-mannosidase n=1 Tax=Microthyrium microscopicum TaxID=703497 RepID=A0A6A6U9F5_9PEZI|nr:mannan endo-1,6-alpha-mannosidase DCW1 precursor [Microthyrium microscopicum]
MRFSSLAYAACSGLLATTVEAAITLDTSSTDSIKAAASSVAKDMMTFYSGDKPGGTPGLLPGPYFWWEAGAMFGSLIDYWYYTGDTTYNDLVTTALQFQVGPSADYMPPNQTKDEGNDDQGFWGMAVLSAAEAKFPDPPSGQPGWLALGQAVFNTQAPRWDTTTCNGGLRWQIFQFNNGYNYKNAISNGCFFNMAARLGRYTGNQTYLDWADKTWNWVEAIGLASPDYHFYDGTDDTINCTQVNHIEWTYNTGVYLYGAAMMWNATQDAKWQTRITTILKTASIFFVNGVMKEVACEDAGNCDTDQVSFKAHLSRWMAATTKVAPFTAATILPLLTSSATQAVKTCTAGASQSMCGEKWTTGTYDGNGGVGEQMSVLQVIQANLITGAPPPVTANTGGTSKSDPSAGGSQAKTVSLNAITTSDRAGAGILTTVILIAMLSGSWWMSRK